MRVYRIPFSTNVERVALAAAYKGLEIDWVDVDPADRTPVLAASGQELVPVLEAGEEVVFDSTAILEWLEERHPAPPLYPRDAARRAEVEIFVDWFNRVWKRPPNQITAELERAEPDADKIAELGSHLREWLGLFERLLAGREYLFGEFSVADCIAFPFLKYPVLGLPRSDEELFHRVLVEQMPLAGQRRLAAWIRRVDERPRA
jgi:glutathione S-transferase